MPLNKLKFEIVGLDPNIKFYKYFFSYSLFLKIISLAPIIINYDLML